MPARGGFQIADYNNEKSDFTFITGPVTALTIQDVLVKFGEMRGRVENITLGVVHKEWQYAWNTLLSNVLPGDVNAQRERKWLGVYEDTTQFLDLVNAIENPGYLKKFTFEIPTADFSDGRLIAGSDQANFANTSISQFIATYESFAKSPYGGTPRVLSMTGVGRNL